jgi:hypothetical protein
MSDAECAAEVFEPLMAMLLETGPFASDVCAMSVCLVLFGADVSNELVRAALSAARRRGRDSRARHLDDVPTSSSSSLSRANGALDDAGIRAALGSLLRGNSPATKACARAAASTAAAPWLVRYVGSALHSVDFAVLEVRSEPRPPRPHAAASDLRARFENAGAAGALVDSAGRRVRPARRGVRARRTAVRNSPCSYALEHAPALAEAQVAPRGVRGSRRRLGRAAARSSSAPRERGRKLASRRVVVAAEVERLQPADWRRRPESRSRRAALQRKELELIDIDRETDAIAVAPTTPTCASRTLAGPTVRAFHVCDDRHLCFSASSVRRSSRRTSLDCATAAPSRAPSSAR